MIIVRFKCCCQPEKAEQALALFREVVTASRQLDGVVSFDVAIDVTNPNTFVATEVFVDLAAMQRQEALPATQRTIGQLGELVAAAPEATIFEVSSSRPWGA